MTMLSQNQDKILDSSDRALQKKEMSELEDAKETIQNKTQREKGPKKIQSISELCGNVKELIYRYLGLKAREERTRKIFQEKVVGIFQI